MSLSLLKKLKTSPWTQSPKAWSAMYHRRSTGIGRSKSEARCAMTLLPHVDRATFKTQHPLKPLGMGKVPMMSPIQDKEKERLRFTL